ncbi:MAG: hypothetical protein RMJ17_00630, partial [Candidatus Aenigmarchaeota archaeon]|nr:hypothetical protein [Candidatus Aenigmarchaeota archaeon]MDW8149093.1 hypothetical protein [Candidatus Aenigmarchaeota archaeon]
KEDFLINETLITKLTVKLESPSTAYDKITILTTITNRTNITDTTSNESRVEISVKTVASYYYVNYERIFSKFYDEQDIKARTYTVICGVSKDIYAKDVTSYKFEKAGVYYIYGSFGYKIIVE